MLERLNFALEIVSFKVDKNDKFYAMYVLAIYGLLANIKEEYAALVEYVFINTDIYIEDDDIINILEKNDLNIVDLDDMKKDTDYDIANAISNPGYYFSFVDDKLKCVKDNAFLVCSSKDIKPFQLLNSFIHEMYHLIKSCINGCKKIDDNTYDIRTGLRLSKCHYDKNTDFIEIVNIYEGIDEVINTFQTTDVMRSIKNFDSSLLDGNVKTFFNKLLLEDIDKNYGYDFLILVVEDLWNCKFKELIEDKIIIGDFLNIEKEFDKIVCDGAFSSLANNLDLFNNYSNIDNNQFNNDDIYLEIRNIIDLFLEKTKEKVKVK